MPSEHRFVSFDGTPIAYRITSVPSGQPKKGAVLVVHGMGEHGARYDRLAAALAAAGFETYAPDLRGFGRSGGTRAFVRSFSDYHRDLAALHAHAIQNEKNGPIFLLGHSLGGLIAASYLALHRPLPPCRGLLLSSPLFGIRVPIPFWKRAFGMLAWLLLPKHREWNRVDPKALTHDTEILTAYEKDPLIERCVTTRLFGEIQITLSKWRRIATGLTVPALILQAGDDTIVSPSMTEAFFHALAATDKSMRTYPAYHHEIFNEIGSEKAVSEALDWIVTHCK